MNDSNYTSLSDGQLISLVSENDKTAEEVLVSRYLQKVKLIARRFFLVNGDEEDLIQEGMIGLLSAIRNYDPANGAAFSSFASTCIRNRIIDLIKTNPVIEFKSTDDLVDTEKAPNSDPEELYIESENYIEKLDRYKGRLSKFEYKILGLYLEGVSYSEMAALLNKPQASVYNAMQRIRRKLSSL